MALGTLTGMVVDERLSTGQSLVRVVVDGDGSAEMSALRSRSWPVTGTPANGVRGPLTVLMVTVDDAERPWLAPLSFLWHDGQHLFATDSFAPTVRNARAVPAVRVALGHTRDVVIIQGQAETAGSADLTDDQIGAYQTKHGTHLRTWADSVLWIRPVRILAWREENELDGRLLMAAGKWRR